jgi:CheY-like chemotaxis protein
MPIMDGWEVVARLKEEYESKGRASGIPIIVLSSTSGEKSVAFVLKKSVHDSKSGYVPLVTVAKETCVDRACPIRVIFPK